MAKKGHNEHVDNLKKQIVEAAAKIAQNEAARSSTNDDLAATYAALEALGIPRKPLKAVLAYMKLDENERRIYDTTYWLAREALGAPKQSDFFDLLKPKPEGDGEEDGD